MRYVYAIACLLISVTINAQTKTDPAELYPIFKSIKVKWDKNTDYLSGPTNFNECVNGNCADGEGVRIMTGNVESKYNSYTLYGTIFKGKFSEGGNRFNGKVYKFKLPAGGYKKEKELRIGTPLDVTNDGAMKPYYVGEGSYYLGPDRWRNGWDGEVKDLPALAKLFTNAEVHKASFNKDDLSWIDISLPATHRFIRYTGHTFASGDFMFGKALLDNGDLYEGFLLKNSFHGPGKLTKRSGKILQGIWQIDSLTQNVVVEFPEALLKPVLPVPTKFDIIKNDELVMTASHFYGDVINNEASGWGLLKTTFSKVDNNSTDFPGYAYGFWKNNQLDGPGIYLTNPSAESLAFVSGNQTTWVNDFFINTGVYKNGKIVHGNRLLTDYSVWANQNKAASDIPELYLEKIFLSTTPLQGCAMQAEAGFSRGYESKPRFGELIEGYYNDGKLTGFYFKNDFEKKRSYEFLRYTEDGQYKPLSENFIELAEKSNNFCFDAISRYKPLLITEMKTKLAKDIAAEEWAKSPEGRAHKWQVEQDNLRYEAQGKKECDAEFAKIGVKGRTYKYQGSLVILESYNCEKKQYLAWRPRQGNDSYNVPLMEAVTGMTTFLGDKLEPSDKQYQTCSHCEGTGKMMVTTTTTRTKELPWGYFSGIETKSIRTTTKKEFETCSKCGGTAIVLN